MRDDHEKLLEIIGKPAEQGYEYCDIRFNKAVRAVVEIHIQDFGSPSDDIIFMCDYCKVAYPCPTIEAIVKELR